MARPLKNRRVCNPPHMIGFKPYGISAGLKGTLQLSYEEYESIMLVNYKMLSQLKAAEAMNISRPTLTRIYNKAIITIAKAFAEGKALEITGGCYRFDHNWYRCKKCYKLIQGIENHLKCENCNSFSNDELISLKQS